MIWVQKFTLPQTQVLKKHCEPFKFCFFSPQLCSNATDDFPSVWFVLESWDWVWPWLRKLFHIWSWYHCCNCTPSNAALLCICRMCWTRSPSLARLSGGRIWTDWLKASAFTRSSSNWNWVVQTSSPCFTHRYDGMACQKAFENLWKILYYISQNAPLPWFFLLLPQKTASLTFEFLFSSLLTLFTVCFWQTLIPCSNSSFL